VLAVSAPSLGNAASFAVLGGSAVNNSGPTVVTGNLGVSPGNTITGFRPPGVVQLGDIQGKALSQLAQHDAGIAYGQLTSGTCMALPSLSPPPGTYCISQLTGVLTLAGDASSVWIFRTTGTLTTDPDSSVLVINGAQPGNVFWQVGASAILGERSAFAGNLIAHDNITLSSGASAFGRLLALTGAVTLDTNNVLLCTSCNAINLDPATLPDGIAGTQYTRTIVSASGGADPYTYKLISGSLPSGLDLTPGGVLSGTPMECGAFPITVAATDAQGCSGKRAYTIVIASRLTLSPQDLPPAKACLPYKQTITAMGGSGPYIYTTREKLPDGLTLIQEPPPSLSATLSAMITIPADYTFTVMAEDAMTHCVVSRTYTLNVLCNVMVLPETLPDATACALYCKTFTASCGTAPYTFSISSGGLPTGYVLSPNGKLCGTTTAPGPYTFTVTATDANSCTASRTYTLKVACNIAISPPVLPDGSVNTPYSQQLMASCGTPPYTFVQVPEPFSRGNVSGAPPLTLSTDGLLSGTPTAAGVYHLTVTTTDSAGCTGTRDYTIFICPLTISPATLPAGMVGVQYGQPLGDKYGQEITVNGGSGRYRFSVPPGTLPPGLTLDPMSPVSKDTALISGTPTTSGIFTFTVTASDALSGCVGTQTYTIVVNCNLALFPATLPAAELGTPYTKTIIATGGTTPFTFNVSSGALPPGLALNTMTGEISGTPLLLGSFNFCITVTDSTTPPPPCGPVTRCYTIDVIPPLVGGPTLSGWGMLVLSILLAGAGLVVIRRNH
jgi:hypothetical protein